MKVAIVPAQITTVEDKVAGNLGLSQLLLLVVPVFLGSAVFIILPPSLQLTAYKAAIIAVAALLCCILAIRIKGRILLTWLMIALRYNLRPRYHIFNKNDVYLRNSKQKTAKQKIEPTETISAEKKHFIPEIDIADAIRIRNLITDPKANLYFKKDRKGALRVYITEVK